MPERTDATCTTGSALTEPQAPFLAPGDVVMFRFPSSENLRKLEKTRPCLVLELYDDEAVLAYGTTRDRNCSRNRELHVVRPTEIMAAGLWRPTRFLGTRTVRMALDSSRFRPSPAGGPICGSLTGKSRRGLARMRALACPAPLRSEPTGRARRRPAFLGGEGR